METKRFYIAGKIIEISIYPKSCHKSLRVTIHFSNSKSRSKKTREQIILQQTSLKNPLLIAKKVSQLINRGNCNPVQIVLYIQKISERMLEDMFMELLNKMLEKENLSSIDELMIEFVGHENFGQFIEIMESMLSNISSKTFRNPYPAADTIIKFGEGVVLVYRKNPPRGWALPGGFINYGESAEKAAVREAQEETGLIVENLKLFGVFSNPDRDPRFHTISIIFTGTGKGRIKAGDDASKVKVFSENSLPKEMAFDHRKILRQFFSIVKKDMKL